MKVAESEKNRRNKYVAVIMCNIKYAIWFGFEICKIVFFNSSEVCGRSDGGVRGEGGAASRIGFEPLFVCNDDG